ncbi:aminotransferase class I/II-fold pyridoxal phosphate-dependent enzyme [Aurantibacter sp.]|uniref:aminotransferase class I/II-fold pyridoxal phosphate-dependent enzyme n=1 Tax=Aurantibacter sp. TaxID=2807103 RepID=UPI0035C78CC6
MQHLDKKSLNKLNQRISDHSLRSIEQTSHLIDFSSNDYIGFAKNTTIFNNTLKFLETKNLKNNGATGSRLISGNHTLYDLTEDYIAKFHSVEKALIYNSGYNANIGLIASICQRNDIIFYDEFCHASIREAIILSNAKAFKFKHNSIDDLNEKLSKSDKNTTIYIITESVFSMDGDSPDIEKLIQASKQHSARLIIDEAHAFGVFGINGCGLINSTNSKAVFARIITFGKALGCHGAAILGCTDLINYLVNFSKSLIYTTALPPHSIATIYIAYQELEITKTITQLKNNISFFNSEKKRFQLQNLFIESDSAIQCIIIKGNDNVKKAAQKLQDNGFNVKAILSPTVPKDLERLRFCLHNYNTNKEITDLLQLLKNLL